MNKRRKRTSRKKRWMIFLLIAAIPLFYFGRRAYKLVVAVHEEKSLKQEILILKAKNEVLRNRISEYKRGNLLEAKARDELGMIKKGEKVYLIRER
ncbi:MAG: septum formation initiator family protein [bacterium]